MPEEAGGGGAPGSPGLGEGVEFGGRRAGGQALQLVRGDGQREVAARPGVRPAERHQQVDVRRPVADPFDFQQLGFRPGVRHPRKRLQVQPTAGD